MILYMYKYVQVAHSLKKQYISQITWLFQAGWFRKLKSSSIIQNMDELERKKRKKEKKQV